MAMEPKEGHRRYNVLRRLAQAKQTRASIADAARRVFVSRGWASTTVREVAREAGVSVPTVYAAYRNKKGLLWALADTADLAADLARMVDELEADPEPERQLLAMVGYDRRRFQLAGDFIALVRDAGRVEPELAALYQEGRRQADKTRFQVFSAWPPGALRRGVQVFTAVDVYAALCNIDVFSMLTRERAWSPERVERWWGDTLTRELLGGAA